MPFQLLPLTPLSLTGQLADKLRYLLCGMRPATSYEVRISHSAAVSRAWLSSSHLGSLFAPPSGGATTAATPLILTTGEQQRHSNQFVPWHRHICHPRAAASAIQFPRLAVPIFAAML